MAARVKSIIVDLLSPRGARPISVAAIVEATALFGISTNNTRVTLVRLAREGLLDRTGEGTYTLSARALPLNQRVRRWARDSELLKPWNGRWLTLHAAAPLRATQRRAAIRALRLARLAEATPMLAVRPDNLRIEPARVAEELTALGMPGRFFVAQAEVVDGRVIGRWRRELWDLKALAAGYARLGLELERAIERLPRIPFERALVETFTLGGEVIRELALDPLLPEEIMPGDGRERLRALMREYDRAGRGLWRRFMGRFESPRRDESAPFLSTMDPRAEN